MLTLRKMGQGYTGTLHHPCNFSVNLKLFQSTSKKQSQQTFGAHDGERQRDRCREREGADKQLGMTHGDLNYRTVAVWLWHSERWCASAGQGSFLHCHRLAGLGALNEFHSVTQFKIRNRLLEGWPTTWGSERGDSLWFTVLRGCAVGDVSTRVGSWSAWASRLLGRSGFQGLVCIAAAEKASCPAPGDLRRLWEDEDPPGNRGEVPVPGEAESEWGPYL